MEQQSSSRAVPIVFFLAAAASLGSGWSAWHAGACPSCTGLLSLILPLLGALFYAGLGVVAWRAPASPLLPNALSFSVFAHACLVSEMLLQGRLCYPCAAVAALALLAAILYLLRHRQAWIPIAAGLLLGGVSGFLQPVDRVDDLMTRTFWPARLLNQTPAFVDHAEVLGCTHASRVRIFTYEDERVCQSCAGLEKRLLPDIRSEFADRICVHPHSLRHPGSGQILPVLVVFSRANRLVVVEGNPGVAELAAVIRDLLRD